MDQSSDHALFVSKLEGRRSGGPVIVPHVIGGQERLDGEAFERVDPSTSSTVVSIYHDATPELVQLAVETSRTAQREWEKVPLAERVARMRPALKHVEAALDDWTVRVATEIGKPFGPARAEAVEVLDILRLYLDYAQEAGIFEDERLAQPNGALANISLLRPYGVFGVIAPFNYPTVQAANAVIASLVMGNGAVIKTAHQAPWSGQAAYEMCMAMDLPKGLVNIVHGKDDPGRALAASDIDGISFTGSVSVGMSILRQYSEGSYPRPVIAEMGGKNPVIVTESADLEAAADGIVFSAFDLGGQKCSALSRVLVLASVHDRLAALVREKAARIIAADPAQSDAYFGPLVDAGARRRFAEIVEQARNEGFAVSGGNTIEREGYFVEPAVVASVPASHDLATIEHFVPFLTISPVDTFEESLEVANATPMGLTAGLYTGDVEQARTFLRRIEAGCINVNVPGHATTGWWPGLQTFGGWKASGSSGKQAHGRYYLQLFGRQQARKVPKELEYLLRD